MSKQAKRAVLIGLDGANYEAIKPLLEEKRLPNISMLLQQGTFFPNAHAPYPTLTGSNWASIATGAWPGTHGVTCMSYHVTGEPNDYWYSGFTSDAVEAETLWEALAKTGKKSIVLKYTGSWPPRHPDVTMIDGGGGRPFWGGSILELSHSQFFSTEPVPNGNLVKAAPAKDWKDLPTSSVPPLEFPIQYEPQSNRILEQLQFEGENIRKGKALEFWGIVYARGNNGYDTIAICGSKDMGNALTILGPREWSEPINLTLEIDKKKHRGSLRITLERLDQESGSMGLFFWQLYPTDGFTQPAEIGEELISKFGSYVNHPAFSEAGTWLDNDYETFIKCMEYQNEWLGRAGRHLMETREWDFFAMQCHCIDYANHYFVPRHGWTEEDRKVNLDRLARCYESVDRMVGEILAGADDNSLICVVSDHGATESPLPELSVNEILKDAGLLTYEEFDANAVRPIVDLSKTIAQHQRAAYIYINLMGREPGGIVPPEEYEEARDRVIAALCDYRDPGTGRNPFSMILRKEDARILGLYDNLGRDIGDIVYALLPEYDHEHGRQLPASTVGGQTMKPLLIFKGPSIKGGVTVDRTTWLVDVAPTIAQALDWPMPSEAEGAVLYQMFDDHKSNFPREEFLNKQKARLEEIRSRFAQRQKAATVSSKKDLTVEAPTTEQRQSPSREMEKLPDTIEELKEALIQARSEARHWKQAYEQYHRITHGN